MDDEYCGIYPAAMMMESDGMNRKTKTICIHVDEERLKELHIRAAQAQKSLQDYVTDLIRKDLYPYQQSSLLPEQKAALNDLSKEALSVRLRLCRKVHCYHLKGSHPRLLGV